MTKAKKNVEAPVEPTIEEYQAVVQELSKDKRNLSDLVDYLRGLVAELQSQLENHTH